MEYPVIQGTPADYTTSDDLAEMVRDVSTVRFTGSDAECAARGHFVTALWAIAFQLARIADKLDQPGGMPKG